MEDNESPARSGLYYRAWRTCRRHTVIQSPSGTNQEGFGRYLEENPETRAVLSGGQGQGEQISEAEAMYRYLTEHGIDGSRLILEDRSTNTKENLDFSLEKIGTLDTSIGIVTNHFHVFRGVAIGRKCGCRQIYPIPARYRTWRLLVYIPREILAIIKDKIVGNL